MLYYDEAVRFVEWLGIVLSRFWGWAGVVSTTIFLLDYIPTLQPRIDRLVSRENRWGFLVAGIAGVLLSSFLAWQDQYKETFVAQHKIEHLNNQIAELSRPNFEIGIGQVVTRYESTPNLTLALLSISVSNTGSQSSLRNWSAHYKSPTMNSNIEFVTPIQPVPFGAKGDVGAIQYDNSQAIINKTGVIVHGDMISGRQLVAIAGDRREEIESGRAEITVTVHDYNKVAYMGRFIGSKAERLSIQPGDRLIPNVQ